VSRGRIAELRGDSRARSVLEFSRSIVTASHAARCTGRVEGRAPTSIIVLSQLQVITLPVHPHCDVPGTRPGVQPCTQSM